MRRRRIVLVIVLSDFFGYLRDLPSLAIFGLGDLDALLACLIALQVEFDNNEALIASDRSLTSIVGGA